MTPGNPGRLLRILAALVLMAAAVLPAALELAGPAPFGVIGAGAPADRAVPPHSVRPADHRAAMHRQQKLVAELLHQITSGDVLLNPVRLARV
ncbi:hypothetical protein ACWEQL_35255, partial [Kitasatospora sp. NPDC004240]